MIEEEPAAGEGAVKREADTPGDQTGRSLKRKKTVTWADGDAEVATAAAAAADALASSPVGGSPALTPTTLATKLQQQQQQQDAAVVELPCDGLYDELTLDLLEQQEAGPEPAGEEPLPLRQLLERRLARTEQLEGIYQAELWDLLDELRLRHSQFVAQRGQAGVWKDAPAAAAAEAQRQAGSQQQQQRAPDQKQEQQKGGQAEAEATPEPEQQQQQQQQPAKKRQRQAGGTAAGGAKPKAGKDRAEPKQGEQKDVDQDEQQEEEEEKEHSAEGSAEPSRDQEAAAATPDGRADEGGTEPGGALRALWERHLRGEPLVPPAAEQEEDEGQQDGEAPAGKGKRGRHRAGNRPVEKKRTRLVEAAEAAAAAEAARLAEEQRKLREQQAALPQPPAVPLFEKVESWVLGGVPEAAGLPPSDAAALLASRRRFVQRLSLVGRLEQSALAAACRELDSLGALALLCGRRRRYVLRRSAVVLGRCTDSQGKVDVDLSAEVEGGSAALRVSRHQAQLFLDTRAAGWRLRCTGRRGMLVNGVPLAQGQSAALPNLSHVAVGGVSLLFVANSAATARALARSGALLAP